MGQIGEIETLRAELAVLEEMRRRRIADPLRYTSPTAPAAAWHADPSRTKLLRGPNQGGKTWAGVREALWRMGGCHPYLSHLPPPPVHGWVVTVSWKQSLRVQRKLYELLPKGWVDWSTCRYSHKNGFSGGYLELCNGSSLSVVTGNQDTVDLASATLDFVWCDEPPLEQHWGELNARLLVRRGDLFLTMTPIGRPVEWLREKTEELDGTPSEVSDHVFALTVANCTPLGGVPFLDQQQIDDVGRSYLPHEREARLRGEWPTTFEGRVFDAFHRGMVRDTPPSDGTWQLGVGVDHGGLDGAQAAVLVACQRIRRGVGRLWVLDESVNDDATEAHQDAEAIVAMLRRNDLVVADVDVWRGDRPYGGRRGVGAKSNGHLERELRYLLQDSGESAKGLHFKTPRKFAGSGEYGSRQLQRSMVRNHFAVDRRCRHVIEALECWQGRDDEFKHKLDALRYIAVDMLDTDPRTPQVVRLW